MHPTNPSELGNCWIYTGYYNERRRMPEWRFEGKNLIPYRIVWEMMKGEPWPDGFIALHSCDRRNCCNVAHFRPGTIAENNAEKEDRERDNGLSHRDVRIIRFLLGMDVARAVIATLMEVSVSTIHGIAQGRTHVRTDAGIQTELTDTINEEHTGISMESQSTKEETSV